jgi:hypothetical protein
MDKSSGGSRATSTMTLLEPNCRPHASWASQSAQQASNYLPTYHHMILLVNSRNGSSNDERGYMKLSSATYSEHRP